MDSQRDSPICGEPTYVSSLITRDSTVTQALHRDEEDTHLDKMQDSESVQDPAAAAGRSDQAL
jgi:hypothetical protein